MNKHLEAVIAKDYVDGVPFERITRNYGLKNKQLLAIIDKHGIPRRKKGSYKRLEEWDQVGARKLILEGWDIKIVAEAVGIDSGSLNNFINDTNLVVKWSDTKRHILCEDWEKLNRMKWRL